jgi:hypothetical protein
MSSSLGFSADSQVLGEFWQTFSTPALKFMLTGN